MKYTVFLDLEPYLMQWFIHENGGTVPIHIKRGSCESDLLEFFLRPVPKGADYVPQLKPLEGQVEIVLPWFASIDIRSRHYLSPKAAVCLHACIKNRFKVQLWKDLYTVGNVIKRNDIIIETWMKRHGIEIDDKNWNTIAKILQRKRAIYCENKRLTDHKSSKHQKKSSKK